MSIRYCLLIFFLSSISSCSADSVTCKNGTTCSFNGSSSGILSSGNLTGCENICSLDLSRKNINLIDHSFWTSNRSSLTSLDLSLNNISQTLPNEIGNFTSLESLNLSANSFYGEIPFANLTKLEKLRDLDLSRNQFNGSLVTNKLIGIANLSSLKHLNLSSNSLQGKIPQSISDLTKLTYLDLSGNHNLAGPIISSLSKINSLVYLNLSGINLDSETSLSSIRNLAKLSRLDLSSTKLRGVIPAEIVELKNLTVLNLSGNDFNDSVPNLAIMTNLRVLDLSHNNLTDRIPDFTIMRHLSVLNLSSNNFSGSVPNFSNMTDLTVLDLSHNKLEGQIPDFSMASLTFLNLSSNDFSGSVQNFSNTSNLTVLDLSHNKLEGQIPDFSMASLTFLNLSSNDFSGSVQNFSNTSNLTVLDLSHNKLEGQIPVFSMANLTWLNLSSNNFSGLVPNFANTSNLRVLDLSHNKLEGNISDFANTTNLTELDLSHNNLTGQIPDFTIMRHLSVLDLSFNDLEGQIPDFSNMTDLTVLDLSHNNLSGRISEAMEKKMQNMTMVSISDNGDLTSCSTNQTFLSIYEIEYDSSCGRGTGKSKTTIVLAAVLPIFFLIVIFAFLIFAYRRRRKLWAPKLLRFSGDCSSQGGPYKFQTDAKEWEVDVKLPTTVPVLIFDRPLTKISFDDLLIATSNFSRQSLLAEEKSGLVYAGYLPEGHPVAIKVLVNGLPLSDQEVADELERLAQIKHQNLVQLLGYCFAGRQRIVLYDYNMQNGTLRDLLHKVSDYREPGKNFSLEDEKYEVEGMTNDGQVQNTWEFRHKIALGVARGLAFLHHGCSPSIIHGFIRAHSVLLDSNLEPRLSDYALYRLTSIKFQDDNPYGSPGYMAEATAESDVYDFGILLFELLTGKQASDDQNPGLSADNNLVEWVRGLSKKDMLSEAIDAKIRGSGPEKQMEEALKIGYLCTADIPSKRPSMKQVVGLLKDIEPNVENNGT